MVHTPHTSDLQPRAHIAFIVRGLHDVGGIERVTTVVATMLSESSYRVSIVCLQGGAPYFELPPHIRLVYLQGLSGRTRTAKLRAWIHREHPAAVVVSGTNRPLFILQAAKGYPIIAWEHLNITISSHPLHGIYRRCYARHATMIVTLSEADAEAWHERMPHARVTCIPNPATLPPATPSRLETPHILAIGRLAGQKGFDLLIQAWAMIAPKHPDWRLRIIGSGRKEKQLKALSSKLGITDRIDMIPATKDVIPEYQNASVYALTSRYEGFGLVLVEAMQMGLPIVSFDCPHGPAEIVSHGETGLLVPNGDIPAFAHALDRMLSSPDLRRTMSAEALRQVERYGTGSITQRWTALLEHIIGENKQK